MGIAGAIGETGLGEVIGATIYAGIVIKGIIYGIDPVSSNVHLFNVTGANFLSIELPSIAGVQDFSSGLLTVDGKSVTILGSKLYNFYDLLAIIRRYFCSLALDGLLFGDLTVNLQFDTSGVIAVMALDFTPEATPLPGALALFATGLGALRGCLGGAGRRKQQR